MEDWQVSDVAVGAAHRKLGLSVEKGEGVVVVVRPDGYVGVVVRLIGEETVDGLEVYFGTFAVSGKGVRESARL